jgi:hypothetical protein
MTIEQGTTAFGWIVLCGVIFYGVGRLAEWYVLRKREPPA